MSGHITRMSRGSSVGSSWSRPTSTSRSTSTCRDGPWQACTWRLRSAGSWRRPARSSTAGAWLARRSCWSSPRRVAGSVGRRRHGVARREPGPVERAAQLAGVAAQRGEQRVADQPGRLVVVAGDHTAQPVEARPRARARPAGGRGGRRGARRARRAGRPRWRAAGCARTATAAAAGRARHRRRAASRPSWRGARRAAARRRRVEQPSPQLGLPGQVGVEVAAGPVGVAPLAPVGDEGGPLDGVRREQRREPDGHAVAAVAAYLGVVARQAVAEVGGQGRAPRPRRGWRRWWRAAARPGARGPRGRPASRPSSSETSDRGWRNRTPAHTPSPPVSDTRAGGRAAGSASAPRRGRGRRRPPGPAGRRAGAPAGPPAPPPAGRCAGPGAGGAPRGDPIGGADTTGPARSRDARRPSCRGWWCR